VLVCGGDTEEERNGCGAGLRWLPWLLLLLLLAGATAERAAENDGPACKKADINGRNAHGTASGPPLVP
jgi:hypothetical protein